MKLTFVVSHLIVLFSEFHFSQGWISMDGLVGNLFGARSKHRCQCTCGLTNRKVPRLVGGKTTQFNEYPWTVALLYKGHYFCGGTIINERYVLTAAHCIRGANKTNIKVLAGEHVRSFPIETHSKYYDVVYIVYHHLFNSSTFNNDIGLVKIKGNMKFMWYARPACLPMPNIDYVGDLAVVAGWGKVHEEGDITDNLQAITIPVFSNEFCRRKLKYKPDEITDNMICAGYANGRRDSCHGDSGGGLLWEGRDNKVDIIGVVSWGHGCGRPGYPGIYTRVNKYLSWIAYHTRDTCFCGRRLPRSPTNLNQ